jgi:hypothetical protein
MFWYYTSNEGGTGMKLYRKRGTTPMTRWHEGMDMTGVSISEADRQSGSPKEGDMIALNPNDSRDRWLVAKDYFEENYEPV